MSRSDFDKKVDAILAAVTNAVIAEHLTDELAAAYRAAGRTLPPDFLRNARCALDPTLEPNLDRDAARAVVFAAHQALEGF